MLDGRPRCPFRVALAVSRLLPVYSDEQTIVVSDDMSRRASSRR